MLTEVLAQIRSSDAPKFTAGLVLWDDIVVEAAPIIGYMKRGKWTRGMVAEHCQRKGWQVSVVHEMKWDSQR